MPAFVLLVRELACPCETDPTFDSFILVFFGDCLFFLEVGVP